jgi:hypothetical protein
VRYVFKLFIIGICYGLAACSKGGGPASTQLNSTAPAVVPAPLFPAVAVSTLKSNYDHYVRYGLQVKNTSLANNIPMSFVPLGYTVAFGGHVGQCIINLDNSREMRFDPLYWEGATDADREIIVFHELGHCFENRIHTSDYNYKGQPASIMNPFVLDAPIYIDGHDDYITELFTHTNLFDPSAPALGPGSAGETSHFISYYFLLGAFCDHE